MRNAILILLLCMLGLAAAAEPFSTEPTPPTPREALLEQLGFAVSVLVPLMFLMITIAAIVYVVGQLFGTETRARASVWAQSMLVAVGVSALIVVLLYLIVPGFLTGAIPPLDLENLIRQIAETARFALVGLIAVLLVIAAAIYVIGQFSGAETRARAVVWATGLLSGAILCAVIYIVVFEIMEQLRVSLFASGALAVYRNVIFNIVLFMTFLVLGTYLLSKLFKVPEWEAYLNIELSNVMTSILVIAFVLGFFTVSTIVASGYTGEPSLPKAAISYMQNTVAKSVLDGLFDVYQIQTCTSMLSTFTRRIGEYVLTQTYKVFPGMDTFVSITNVLGMGLVTVYGSVSAQIAFLYLVDAIMLPFILPAGLILRFFPPTRDAGAFLIALAFGFQIVFPMTYMINKGVYTEIGGTGYDSPTLLIQSMCGPFKFGVWGFLLNPDANPIFSAMPGGVAVGRVLGRIFSEGLLNYFSMSEFLVIMRYLSSLSLLALFMPSLSMMITIAFINAMTKFILGKT